MLLLLLSLKLYALMYSLLQSGYEEDLSEEERRILERGGAVICSSHHRSAPSAVSSASSSSASVATSGGSTTALIRQKRPRTRTQPRAYRPGPGDQRELNLLLAQPRLPVVVPSKEKMVADEKAEAEQPPPSPIIIERSNRNYVPQVGNNTLHTCNYCYNKSKSICR